ncbi:hypothetical protein G5B47_20150 [Paenibacillus sp. 7124]|uniref:SLH domain-containing protein n=1 Tax=Paenibacillus apii TaxID=1850370 RepID=A0A6M1PQ55_9BACL|nr:Ig-like domain-containing protein [Paenibacillus apii]NGM84718.1 hypothetical protein [Paenibacillus apii]NJJ41333.1 hypothetical protein [Paenibacillus apii]
MKSKFKAFTRKFSLFLVLAMVISLISVAPAQAAQTTVHISTAQDLVDLANTINSRPAGDNLNMSMGDYYVEVDADIDMSGVSNWQGIGKPQNFIGMTGTFDGNGHTISGISLTNAQPVGPKGGLFNLVADITIKDLKVSGSVNSNRFIGGIVGRALGSLTIQNCIADMSLTLSGGASNSVGGLVGQMGAGQWYTTGHTMTIINSAALGTFTSNTSGNPVGGLIGHIYTGFNVNIINSYVAASLVNAGGITGALVANINYNTFSIPTLSTLNITNTWYLSGMSGSIIGEGTLPPDIDLGNCFSFTAGTLDASNLGPAWENKSGVNVFNGYSYPDILHPVMPTANPAAGAVAPGTTVTLSTATVGASVYYAVYPAGIDPATVTFGLYNHPIVINSDTTIKAYASANGEDSDVMTADYTIRLQPVTGVELDQHAITLTPGATGTLAATVAPADATNKNVIWTTSDSTVATVTYGVVTAVGAGTANITVRTADGSFTDTCEVTVNPAAVAATGVELDQHAITLTPGATGTLTATVAPTDATNKNVIWTTSDSTVATVTYGVVTAVGAGKATITVRTADGNFTDTCEVTVNPAALAVTGVGLDQHAITLTPGATGTLAATVAPTDATNKNVIWTTSDSTVATVTYGVVTAVGAGKATITVRTADGNFTDTCEVTVNPAALAVTGVGLDQHAITLTPGAIGALTATVAPADATNKNVIWTTSDSTVATVTYGVVTAVGAGKATITVRTADGSFKDSCEVTVSPAAVAVTGVGLDQHAITLTAGASGTLTATVAPVDATNKNVIWTTSDSTVATVAKGVVTAVGAGTATITVTTEDGSFKDTCQVTVNAAATSGGGPQAPTTTQQTSTTDLGQVIQSGSTATLQVDAKKVADQLKDAAQSELVINLSQVTAGSGQSKAVQLPAEVINLVIAANKPIVIQDSGLKIVIPTEVLIQGQNMTFSTTQVSSQTVASAPEHVESKAVYSFDAWAGETAVHNFTKSISITLPIPAGVTELGKLGVYYLNETTGQWDYMGGRIVDGKLVFNTNHFSKYMVAESQKTFGDIVSHWAKADIEVMVARHVINGTDADTFAPQNNITRAEFAALLSRVLKLSDAADEGTFKDITGGEWYANDVRKAAKAGIIQGSDGNFHPGDSITRQEMAVMINRAYSYAGGKIGTLTDLAFIDKGSISAWANDAVQSVYTLGIINGYPDGSFGALGHATRAEGTVMLKTFMDKLGL